MERTAQSRVVAVQFDVELPTNMDAQIFINFMNDKARQTNLVNIVGSEVVGDLTVTYEKDYPELFKLRGLQNKENNITNVKYALVRVIEREIDQLILFNTKSAAHIVMLQQVAETLRMPVEEINALYYDRAIKGQCKNDDDIVGITDRHAWTEVWGDNYDWQILQIDTANIESKYALVEVIERNVMSLKFLDTKEEAHDRMCKQMAAMLDKTEEIIKEGIFDDDTIGIEEDWAWAEGYGENYVWKIINSTDFQIRYED